MMTAAPFRFDTLLGQDKAKEMLRRSFAKARLSHAYLFRGPVGVGKRQAAAAFAAFANCLSPLAHDACGQCASCRKLAAGSHPDLLLIEPEGTAIKIGQIRRLKEALGFPPYEGRVRVVVLNEIQTMRREAANSLLKTLEEPPAHTILILTADESGDLLDTIVSRCQVIPFFPLPYSTVTATLVNEDAIAADTAAVLAAVAEGSLGRARLLEDKGLVDLRREIVSIITRYRPDDAEAVEVIYALADRAAELKEHLPELFDLLRLWLRDCLLLKGGAPQALRLSRDCDASLAAAVDRWQPQELLDRLGLIDRAQRQLAHNCNRALVCEVLFFGLL